MGPIRPFMSLVLGLVLGVLLTSAIGCESAGQFRPLDQVEAEQSAKDTTVPFANAYKEKFPAEVQSVDDFYAGWQSKLNKQRSAATSTPK